MPKSFFSTRDRSPLWVAKSVRVTQQPRNLTLEIVYNCRMVATWKDDMALSITFFPQTPTANAVWFGCNLSKHEIHGYYLTDAELLASRLANFKGGVLHPMLLPTKL